MYRRDVEMRGKRLTMLGMSAILAFSSLAFAAPAVNADSDHPMIIIQAVDKLDQIAVTSSYFKKAQLNVSLFRDLRHWTADHKTPPIVVWAGCTTDYNVWFTETRALAFSGFRYFRGMATGWEEYPPGTDRTVARISAMLFYNRLVGRQTDEQKDLLNCLVTKMEGQIPWWL
jgi:hypothetical protein